MFFLYLAIVIGLLFSAHKATRLKGLLNAALWLAGTSCMTSILIYMMGSPGIAVIELSVGAGLVTVLFVFAISIIGEETITTPVVIPKWLSISIVLVSFGLLGFLLVQQNFPELEARQSKIVAETVWESRKLDIYVQAALLISGILGILMLFAPSITDKERWRNE